jgi:hypothetical protein
MKLSNKKLSKGSKYTGVYKCSKTNLYYCLNYINKKCYKSKLFKNEKDAASKYDNVLFKFNPTSRKFNFSMINKLNELKKNISKIPKVRLPKVSLSKVSLPKVRLPKVRLPKVSHPKIKKHKIKKPMIKISKTIIKRQRIPEYVKIIIYSKQNDKCNLCHKNLGVGRITDHIIPLCIGGINNINNYQAICCSCNKWKTYKFDSFIKKYIQNNKTYKLSTILNIQKREFNNFNGKYPI